MMRLILRALVGALAVALAAGTLSSCSTSVPEPVVVERLPLDNLDGVVDTTLVALDAAVSSDGFGSLKVEAQEPVTVRIYELGDVDIENALLTYRAHLRTEDVDGHAYLEMICKFADGNGYFSRAIESPLYGTTDWTLQETTFDLKPGENPVGIELNLALNGSGTVWIDDILILRSPRPSG